MRKSLKQPTPIDLITAIRNSFPGAELVYTRGACFEFYKILKASFPQAVPYYDEVEGHVYTEIDGKFYDIKGRAYLQADKLSCMLHDQRLMRSAHRWMPSSNFRVVRLMDDDI